MRRTTGTSTHRTASPWFIGTVLVAGAVCTANAAEVTDMPPALRGDIHIDYGGSFLTGGLDEGQDRIGRRAVERHDFDVRAEFAPTTGVAVVLGIPSTVKLRHSFPLASSMVYDPVTTSGTYLAGNPTEVADYWGSSAHGFLLGVAVSPLSESYKRHFNVTWRLDLAYRTPSPKRTLYSTNNADTRGAAPGGHGLFIGAAFSNNKGRGNPYLDFDFMWESATRVDIVNGDGILVASRAKIQPGATLDLTAGIEVIAGESPEKSSRVAVDLFSGIGYRSWADLPSGFALPDVLGLSSGLVITQGDHVAFRAGLALNYDVNKWVGFRTGIEGRYYTPFTVENVYPVATALDTFEVAWTFELTGKVRLQRD